MQDIPPPGVLVNSLNQDESGCPQDRVLWKQLNLWFGEFASRVKNVLQLSSLKIEKACGRVQKIRRKG